ncbi:hypothetical protein VTH8203_03669 [Vibrio thalassae]|uniref:Uncharacterized protein n=1 Tax=Vibrio thalassae TaxID=1243014 RepID=A0A240ENE3_9VIBR|nr:hypothetical protein VTH8203_03669 [Vibrio thalassae]
MSSPSNLNAMIAQSQYHGIQPILVVTSAVDPIGSLPMLSHSESHVERVRSAIKQLSETHAKKLSAMVFISLRSVHRSFTMLLAPSIGDKKGHRIHPVTLLN